MIQTGCENIVSLTHPPLLSFYFQATQVLRSMSSVLLVNIHFWDKWTG